MQDCESFMGSHLQSPEDRKLNVLDVGGLTAMPLL